MKARAEFFALALLCIAAAAAADPPAPPLTSRAALDAYLAAHAADNPLNELTPGARVRFLVSLGFDASGLIALDAGDLMDELSNKEIRAVLELFGPRIAALEAESHYLDTAKVEKHAPSAKTIGAIEAQYNEYYRAARAAKRGALAARADAIGNAFDTSIASLYEPKALRRADDHELRLLRLAVLDAARETEEPRHADLFRNVFAERKWRGFMSTNDIEAQRDLLLIAHRFADARRVAREFPQAELSPLPDFRDALPRDSTGPTLWRVDSEKRRLIRVDGDLAPLQILVTGSCAASRPAVADIAADPLLGPVFAAHARWLVPAPGAESIAAALTWQRENPQARLAMLYDRAGWRQFGDARMLNFHVVRDGQVLEVVPGPLGGASAASAARAARAAFIAALRRYGLLPEVQ